MVFIPRPNLSEILDSTNDAEEAKIEAAEAVKGNAESRAPVGTGYYWKKGVGYVWGGHYRDKFVVMRLEDDIVLGNKDFKAHWIEWGTSSQPPQAVLRRAVLAAGLKLVEND